MDLVGCYFVDGTQNDGRDDVYAEIVSRLAGAPSASGAAAGLQLVSGGGLGGRRARERAAGKLRLCFFLLILRVAAMRGVGDASTKICYGSD